MCGIGLFVNRTIPDHFKKLLKNRGPDFDTIENLSHSGLDFSLISTVLSHQGEHLTIQPIRSRDSQKVLLWNGEIYDHPKFDHQISDSKWLEKFIENGPKVPDWWSLSSEIKGEFAFIFINFDTREIIFGRDRLGQC